MLIISSAVSMPRLPASGRYEDLIDAGVIDPTRWLGSHRRTRRP
jgi:hypothetical protein